MPVSDAPNFPESVQRLREAAYAQSGRSWYPTIEQAETVLSVVAMQHDDSPLRLRAIGNLIFNEGKVEAEMDRLRAEYRSALPHPCTCRKDVVCGACMSGAADPSPLTATATPPADDVREALADVMDKVWGDEMVLHITRMTPPVRLRYADAILAAFEVRPRGTVTDAEVGFIRAFIRQAGYSVPIHVVRAALEAAREVQP